MLKTPAAGRVLFGSILLVFLYLSIGLAACIFFLGVASFAVMLQRQAPSIPNSLVTPVAILLSLFSCQILLSYGLPLLNFIKLVPHADPGALKTYSKIPFDYANSFNEFTQWSAILLLIGISILPSLACFKRVKNQRFASIRSADSYLWAMLIASGPILILVYLRQTGVLESVIYTMSGDGRNHFLNTQEIRLHGSVPLGLQNLGSPRLANGIAALISAGNGSRGTLQIGDLVGMSFVYLLSITTICISFLAMLTMSFEKLSISRVHRLALTCSCIVIPAVVCSKATLGAVLYDGFLTLALGVAVLSIIMLLAHTSWIQPSPWLVLLQILGLYVLGAAYSFLLPPVVFVVGLSICRLLWVRLKWLGLAITVAIGAVSIFVGWSLIDGALAENFTRTVNLAGAVKEFNYALGVVALIAILLCNLSHFRSSGFHMTPFFVLAAGTGATVYLIEKSSDYERSGLAYYSNKILLANFWVVSPILVISVVFAVASENIFGSAKLTERLRRALLLFAAVLGLLWGIHRTNNEAATKYPVISALDGWANPYIETVRPVLERWHSNNGYFIVWNLADYPPEVPYQSIWEDRLANFWSPAAWNGYRGEGFSTIWAWAYFEINENRASELCSVISAMPLTVVTRDDRLEEEVKKECGINIARFEVLPRLS
jgi:hypothetical protein